MRDSSSVASIVLVTGFDYLWAIVRTLPYLAMWGLEAFFILKLLWSAQDDRKSMRKQVSMPRTS